MPRPTPLARPPPFVHPSTMHPYAAMRHPLTPIRWSMYAVTAAVTWGALLPLLCLWNAIRRLGRGCLRVCDCIISPVHAWSGDADSPAAQWTVVDPAAVRLCALKPQDRIWMVPRMRHAKAALTVQLAEDDRSLLSAAAAGALPAPPAPGAAPSSVIHALLTLSRPVTLAAFRRRFGLAVRKGGPLERMRWRAVRTRTIRRWVPRCIGESSEDIAWMETSERGGWDAVADVQARAADADASDSDSVPVPAALSASPFDIRLQVRSVPVSEWTAHVDGHSGGRDRGNRRSARAPDLVWPEPTASFQHSAQQTEQSQEQSSAAGARAAAVDHSAVLRTARLQSYLTHLSAVPLRSNQPLWELLVLEPDPDDPRGLQQQGLAVFRCSHAVADGVLLSGMILRTLFGGGEIAADAELLSLPVTESVAVPGSATSAPRATRSHRQSRPSCWSSCGAVLRRVWSLWLLVVTGPALLLHKSLQPDDDNTLTRGGGGAASIDGPKQVCWSTDAVSLSSVKRLSRHLHVSLNDLVMNVWLDVLDEYMRAVESMEQAKLDRADRANCTRGIDGADASKSANRRMARAPSSIFAIVPFNVRKRHELEWNQPLTEAHRSSDSSSAVDRASSVQPRELGNRFALLMIDVAMGAAIRDAAPQSEEVSMRDVESAQSESSKAAPDLSADSASFAASPFMRRLRYLSSYMHVIKSSGVEPRLMFGVLSLVLGWLPPTVAAYCLELFAGLPSVVITNNRSAAGMLRMRDDAAEDDKMAVPSLDSECKDEADARTAGEVVIHLDSTCSSSSSSSCLTPRTLPAVDPSSSLAPVTCPVPAPVCIESWVSWAPQRNNVGVCVTIISYAGQLRVSIVADQRCIRHTTAAQLVERYQRKLAALLKLVE